MGEWFLGVQTRAILGLLSRWSGLRILDVGGGHAQLTGPLLSAGHTVTVLGSREVCRKRLEGLLDGMRCTFVVGDLQQLPFPDRSFDVAVSLRTLAHVDDEAVFLRELARVSDRAVLVDFPSLCSVEAVGPLFFRLKRHVEGNTRPYRHFTRSRLRGVLVGSGFTVTSSRGEFLLPMALHRWLRRARLSRTVENALSHGHLTSLFGNPVVLLAERNGSAGGRRA